MDNTTPNDHLNGDTGNEPTANSIVAEQVQTPLVGVMDARASAELAQEMVSVAGALFGLLLPGLPSASIQPVASGGGPARDVTEPRPSSTLVPLAAQAAEREPIPAPADVPEVTVRVPSKDIALAAAPTLVAAPVALPLPLAIPVESFVADQPVAEEAAAAQPHSPSMALLNEIAFLDE